jgi:hypothetical protein
MTSLSKRVTIRFTEDEYKRFQDDVKKSGYNKSEFFRNIVLSNKTKVVNKQDVLQVFYHLNKMGNNLNQQTYNLNKAFLMGKISESLFQQNLKALNAIKNEQMLLVDLLEYSKK